MDTAFPPVQAQSEPDQSSHYSKHKSNLNNTKTNTTKTDIVATNSRKTDNQVKSVTKNSDTSDNNPTVNNNSIPKSHKPTSRHNNTVKSDSQSTPVVILQSDNDTTQSSPNQFTFGFEVII